MNFPLECLKMDASVYMKEGIYPREYKKRCIYPISCQTLHFREYTDFPEFIGFLIAKLEAIMQKKTYYCLGELINQQCCKWEGECWVVVVHDRGVYSWLSGVALTSPTACLF